MWKLRLLDRIARALGVTITYSSRFFDDKSQNRGRTLWTTPDVGEAILLFNNSHKLTREKHAGINHLTIEAQVASREWLGQYKAGDENQLPLGLRERVQDEPQARSDGAGSEETADAAAEGTGGDRGEPQRDTGAEAPAGTDGPVEGERKPIDLSELGVR